MDKKRLGFWEIKTGLGMRNLIYDKNKGLTLMEVLVAASILTIVFGVSFGAMRIYDISLTMGTTKSQLCAQANLALNRMKEELALSSGFRVFIAQARSDPPQYTITFQIPTGDLDARGEIVWGDGQTTGASDQIEYDLGGDNQLIRKETKSGGNTQVLANNITALDVAPTPASAPYDSLTLTVTASKGTQRGIIPAVSVDLSTTVDFKN